MGGCSWIIFYIIYILIFGLVVLSSGDERNVPAGKDVTLVCDVGNDVSIVYWKKDGTNVVTHRVGTSPPVSPKYNISGNTSLVIYGVDKRDEGTYNCDAVVTSGDSPVVNGGDIRLIVGDENEISTVGRKVDTPPGPGRTESTPTLVSSDAPTCGAIDETGLKKTNRSAPLIVSVFFNVVFAIIFIIIIIVVICWKQRGPPSRRCFDGIRPRMYSRGNTKDPEDPEDGVELANRGKRGAQNGYTVDGEATNDDDKAFEDDSNLVPDDEVRADGGARQNLNMWPKSENSQEKLHDAQTNSDLDVPKLSMDDFDLGASYPPVVEIVKEDMRMIDPGKLKTHQNAVLRVVQDRSRSTPSNSASFCSGPSTLSQSMFDQPTRNSEPNVTPRMTQSLVIPKSMRNMDPVVQFAECLTQRLQRFASRRDRDDCELIISDPAYCRGGKPTYDPQSDVRSPTPENESSFVGNGELELLRQQLTTALESMDIKKTAETRTKMTKLILEKYGYIKDSEADSTSDFAPSQSADQSDRLAAFWVDKIAQLRSDIQQELVDRITTEVIYEPDDDIDAPNNDNDDRSGPSVNHDESSHFCCI